MMKNRSWIVLFLLVTLCAFGAWGFADAAPQDIRIAVRPSSPAPGEIVSVSLESYVTDLNRANIIWSVNGKVVEQGRGIKSIETPAATLGKATVISISVSTIDMGVVEKSLSIRPAGVVLLWQASSYTPPFYRGKALAPSETRLTAVAIPNMVNRSGQRLRNDEIVFTWRRNGSVVGSQSGTGKNSFSFENGRLPGDEPLVEAELSAPGENLSAYGQLVVPMTAPSIVFYKNHPLRGILLEKALLSPFTLTESEITLIAYPYYKEGLRIGDDSTAYEWRVNNETARGTGQSNELTLRAPGGSGSALISFGFQNLSKLFESAVQTLTINFGSDSRPFNTNAQ